MVAKLIAAWPLEHYEVWVAFADGVEGAVDLGVRPVGRELPALRDLTLFRGLRIDRGLNALVWPDGSGLDPAPIYRELARDRRRRR